MRFFVYRVNSQKIILEDVFLWQNKDKYCGNVRIPSFCGNDESAPFLQSERDASVQNSEAELQNFEARLRELKLAHWIRDAVSSSV